MALGNQYFLIFSYSKLGYAGSEAPQIVLPTAISFRESASKLPGQSVSKLEDLNVAIGNEALAANKQSTVHWPIRHGQVENWDWMEAYWAQSIYRYLRCTPEDHYFLLVRFFADFQTEPPMNNPENREYTAEIMFETFNVPGLYIGVQAVMALVAAWRESAVNGGDARIGNALTGTVIDSGDGVTHVIPVVDGYVIGSSIKHIPLAGRDVTHFIQQLLRERAEETGLAPEQTMEAAKALKEQLCYCAPDLAREFARLQNEPAKIVKQWEWMDEKTKRVHTFEVGPERFLAGEVFFHPELANPELTAPLPAVVDEVIQSCPIDTRRALYKNVVLSGGSTIFKDLNRRLQKDLQAIVDDRLAYTVKLAPNIVNKQSEQSTAPQVNCVAHRNQRFAVYSGASFFASIDQFPDLAHSRAEYEEKGPSVVRQSRVFGNLL